LGLNYKNKYLNIKTSDSYKEFELKEKIKKLSRKTQITKERPSPLLFLSLMRLPQLVCCWIK